jgi:hypothetical protein
MLYNNIYHILLSCRDLYYVLFIIIIILWTTPCHTLLELFSNHCFHIMCDVKPAFTEKLGHTLPHFQSRDISPMLQVCFCSSPLPAFLRCALLFKHAANLPPKITNETLVVGAAQQGSASSGLFYVYGPGLRLLLHTPTLSFGDVSMVSFCNCN